MFFIVVGCGRVGAELAYGLHAKDHQVAIIDQVGTSFQHLDPRYRGRTIEGEVLSREVLQRAGIEHADGLAAVTNSDTVNAVVAHVARTIYNVPQVVARNYDPRWRMLHEVFGLQVVSSTAWGAQRIEELLFDPGLRTLFSAGNGEVELFELSVPAGWQGRSLGELLQTDDQAVAVAYTHAGRAALPNRDTRLTAGDLLHVSASPSGAAALRTRLAAPPR